MRFYGNEDVALFKAHEKKNRAGIDEDAILAALPEDSVVMHDHVTMNYNDDFQFINVECNQHLERDLQKLIDVSDLDWPGDLKELIASAIHDRNGAIEWGEKSFDRSYINDFNRKLDRILKDGATHEGDAAGRYFEKDHKNLLSRLNKYRENYFRWITDFSYP